MPLDPFASDLPKWHPRRLFLKGWTAARERVSRGRYERCRLPDRTLDALPPLPDGGVAWDETAVTPEQMRYLLAALEATAHLDGTVVVELGAYRGVTTRLLAGRTDRTVVAVDLFHPGWSEAAEAMAAFHARTDGVANVVLERRSSGAAAAGWSRPPASVVFIDAQHNFVNTDFDVRVWRPKLVPGGILALHDTDRPHFAGTREAAHRAGRTLELFAHVDNLTLFRVPA